MAIFADTGQIIGEPLIGMWNSVITALPGIIAAILILILGYLIGALIGHLVKRLLDKTKIISLGIKKMGLQHEIGKWDLSGFLGLITKWYIFLVFLNPAAQVVKLTSWSTFFSDAAKWIPNIILAIIITLAGYVLAEYIAKKIKETRAKKKSLMASTAKIITLVFVVLIALKQIGIDVSIAENTFLIILSGVMLGFALAFGLGFKDEAKSLLRDIKKKL